MSKNKNIIVLELSFFLPTPHIFQFPNILEPVFYLSHTHGEYIPKQLHILIEKSGNFHIQYKNKLNFFKNRN